MYELLVTLLATAGPAAMPPAIEATAIEAAVAAGDAALLAGQARELEGCAAHADQQALCVYSLAYVHWRAAEFATDESAQQDHLAAAEPLLRRLLAGDAAPTDPASRALAAEASALLGSVLGRQITGMWSGVRLGPKSAAALQRAAELAPDNPRVVLAQGLSALFTPQRFGGGRDRAEQLLRRAAALFEQQPADQPWPYWGRVDAHAWLGFALAQRGELAAAREAYQRGLALAPQHAFIQRRLLPELERRETAGR